MARRSTENRAGWEARHAGVPRYENPEKSVRARTDWREGWDKADEVVKERARLAALKAEEDARLAAMPASYRAFHALADTLGHDVTEKIEALIKAMLEEKDAE